MKKIAMGKRELSSSALLAHLVAVMEQCSRVGSPVPGHFAADWQEAAERIVRRVNSFDRRCVDGNDRRAQIRDVAKGLVDAFEPSAELVGPLIVDYEFVAEQALVALDAFHRSQSA